MKSIMKLGLLTLFAALILTSCKDNDSYYYNYLYSYGNIADEGDGDFSIILDSGNKLNIVKNYAAGFEAADGERVYAQYTPRGQETEDGIITYFVDLYWLMEVIVKEPVLQSDMDDPDNAEVSEEIIGNDPIKLTYDIVGNKYLTIEFMFYSERGSGTAHLINLVLDDTYVPEGPEDKTVYLTLRHNGYNDVPHLGNPSRFVRSYGSMSFDLTGIVPDGEDEVPVRVTWTEYGNTFNSRRTYHINRVFSPDPEPAPLHRTGTDGKSQIFNYSIEANLK